MSRVNGKKPTSASSKTKQPKRTLNPYLIGCGAPVAYSGQKHSCGKEHPDGMLLCSPCSANARGVGLEVSK